MNSGLTWTEFPNPDSGAEISVHPVEFFCIAKIQLLLPQPFPMPRRATLDLAQATRSSRPALLFSRGSLPCLHRPMIVSVTDLAQSKPA